MDISTLYDHATKKVNDEAVADLYDLTQNIRNKLTELTAHGMQKQDFINPATGKVDAAEITRIFDMMQENLYDRQNNPELRSKP